ncbi:MAG: endonuclease [Bacteroidales bacterium]|nr:endonuclease [Bacteroidales bacterium]
MKKIFLTIVALSFTIFTFSQIPSGYYDGTEGLSGSQLKLVVHNIIKGHIEFSYNDLRDFILIETDEDPNNYNNLILLYTGRSQAKSTFGGGENDWNREHVWAKSHGDFGNSAPCGTDAHHIRPTDVSVNGDRGHLDFDNGGNPIYDNGDLAGYRIDNVSWEPRDEVKGDVARMIFYMAVRYEGDDGELDLEVVDYVNTYPNPKHGKLSTLLEWNIADPPDDFEKNRNEVVYYYQENRNPFIDHPEFATLIWDPSSSVNELSYENKKYFLYPSPSQDYCYINVSASFGELKNSFTVFDVTGKILSIPYSNESNKIKLDVSKLSKGIYFIKFDSTEILKFVK